MKLFFPASKGQIDYVGYNHAIKLFRKALSNYISDDPQNADFQIYCNIPYHHDPCGLKSNGLPLIVYTMYESTKLPQTWTSFLNRYADIVLVPTPWCKKVFRESGVNRPLYVLSLGFDAEVIKPIPKEYQKELYIYIWQGVDFDRKGRKGFDLAVDAYKELKAENRLGGDTRLIIKARPCRKSKLTMDGLYNGDGILYMQKDMSREELLNLYKMVDCCINPTHGEGFGLIPLEQMAMGKPVILTDYSMPFIDKSYCLPINYSLQKSNVFWNHKYILYSKNGFSYNLTGLSREIPILPKLVKHRPDGRGREICAPGYEFKLTICQKIVNRIMNNFADFQIKYGLFLNHRNKARVLQLEHPGYDAHVDIEDLKNKMEWCYRNRADAENIGFKAGVMVEKKWSLYRMQSDFENIKKYLQTYKQRGSYELSK